MNKSEKIRTLLESLETDDNKGISDIKKMLEDTTVFTFNYGHGIDYMDEIICCNRAPPELNWTSMQPKYGHDRIKSKRKLGMKK